MLAELDDMMENTEGLMDVVTRKTAVLAHERFRNRRAETKRAAVESAADDMREWYDGLVLHEERLDVDLAELANAYLEGIDDGW